LRAVLKWCENAKLGCHLFAGNLSSCYPVNNYFGMQILLSFRCSQFVSLGYCENAHTTVI